MHQLIAHLLNLYVPQAREYLVKAAREHRLVPYGEIMNRFGGRGYVGQVLDALNRQEHGMGRPLLSAIVVRAEERQSSSGFFDLVRSLRPQVTTNTQHQMWEAECDRVWAHYRSS
ncbi:MAG: hypothetical protein EXR65_03575 [Dehalococcoidia bacterium]|nr:hypothetical protein [Dehalococcoidia bacterium]